MEVETNLSKQAIGLIQEQENRDKTYFIGALYTNFIVINSF